MVYRTNPQESLSCVKEFPHTLLWRGWHTQGSDSCRRHCSQMADRHFDRLFNEAQVRYHQIGVPDGGPQSIHIVSVLAEETTALAPSCLDETCDQQAREAAAEEAHWAAQPKQRTTADAEAELRAAAEPMTAADAIDRILLAWKDRDYFRCLLRHFAFLRSC